MVLQIVTIKQVTQQHQLSIGGGGEDWGVVNEGVRIAGVVIEG